MSTKRIIDLQTASTLGSDDYVMIDSATSGTKKYAIHELKTAIEDVEDGSGISAGAIGTDALDDGAVTNAKLGALSVGTSNLQNGAVTLAKIASGSEATTSASGLMSSTDKAKLDAFGAASTYALKTEIAGAYIYRGSVANEAALPTTNRKVGDVYNIIAASSYGQAGANVAWNGSDWDTLGETFDIGNGTVTTSKIADLNVTEGKLANSAVTTNKIADANVTTAKIADANVTTGKLANFGVTTGKIANSAVTSDKIASNAVITEKITDGAVTANKLDASAVTTAKINNLAVTTDKLSSESVTSAKLASNSVTTAKIVDSAVTEGKLANSAVTTNKLNNSAVTTAKIADSNVTTAKIADSNVTTAKIADLNVTEGKLANSAVTTNKLSNSAVTTAKIADSNVMTGKIADLNVTTGKLANDAVTTDKVADGAITRDKLNEEVTDELDFKADVDGYYTDMTVGAADNLTARGDAVEASFIRRTSGGINDIESGNATIKSIKGNTIRWNQLFDPNPVTISVGGVTCTINSDGLISYSGTATASSGRNGKASKPFDLVSGHKYLLHDTINYSSPGNETGWYLSKSSDNTIVGVRVSRNTIFVGAESVKVYLGKNVIKDQIYDCSGYVNIFDLTTMFGAGNEPETVAEFEALYPEPYYAYDAGSLLPVTMTGIATDGFNQWDEEWEEGDINSASGQNMTGSNTWRSKNYIPVFPNTEYYAKATPVAGSTTGGSLRPRFYDASKAYIGYTPKSGSAINGSVFTTPDNAHYMRFAPRTTDVADHEVCLNLSWSGRRNGEYEAFWSSQREIAASTYFPDGMRSAGTVRDELTSTEAITRVGVVDLGTLTWEYQQTSDVNRFRASVSGGAIPGDTASSHPFTNGTKYEKRIVNALVDFDKSIGIGGSSALYVYIRDSSYDGTTLAAFKAQLSGQYINYVLATPIVTPIDPALNLSYRVDDFGTERVMVPEDERSAPPVLDIAYGLNVVDFVRRAPSEYISHASFQQFCIALQTKLGIVITETWDDTDNRYEYSIADAPSS